jgi:hypothetical protein
MDSKSDSRGSINSEDQARAQNTRVSGITLCPFGRSKKAIGHESPIGPCVATHRVDNRQACRFQKTNGAVTTKRWNHREEEAFLRFTRGDQTGHWT